MVPFTPATEGHDHVNAYSRSTLLVGRLLSNFAHTPFEVPEDGAFESVEGYWYWLACEGKPGREQLRALHGWKAKDVGRKLRGTDWPTFAGFRDKILKAAAAKLEAHPDLCRMLAQTGDLPITHYYVYNGVSKQVTGGAWEWKAYERMRSVLIERGFA